MARKILKTISKSEYSSFSLPGGGTPGTPQSMCTIADNNHVIYHNKNNNNSYGYLKRYSNSKALPTSDNNYRGTNQGGHGNGMCYIIPLRTIVVNDSRSSHAACFDAVSLKHLKTIKFSGSNIAYDKVTQQISVHTGNYLYVYPYTYFQGKTESYAKVKISQNFSGVYQDTGAYNGVTYVMNTPGKSKTYIDCYNTGTGKYLGSYYIPSLPELESIDFVSGTIFGCGATNRKFIKFQMKASLQGSKATIKGDTTSTSAGAIGSGSYAYTTDEKAARNALEKKYGNEAKVYFTLRDDGYSHIGTCAIMGNIQQESSFRINAISYDGHNSYGICQWTDSRKTNLKNWCKEHGYKSDSVEGQVKFLEHELESYKDLNSKLKSGTDSLSSLTVLFEEKFERAKASAAHNETRIKYAKEFDARYKAFAGAKFTGMYIGDEGAYAGMGLVAHVEQMISSANYKWLSDWDEDKDSDDIAISEILKKSSESLMNAARLLSESNAVNISELLSKLGSAIQTVEVKKKTKITGSTTTHKLSSSPTWVEAPWFGVYIGDFFIGDLTRGRSPNYIERLTVDKLNGRVNQYTITIIHQIAQGDNPNFIDELIGKNGYDKIIITYGDQNVGSFRDEEAIITDVKQTFNFSSSQITYTISATSNAIAVTSAKYNYPTITEKPSDIIMDLLYGEANSDLLKAFPGMADQSKVLENKLIPDDDLEVEIESMNDVNVLMYLNSLVSAMISKTNKQVTGDLNDSIYMLSYHDADDKIPDGSYFRITKIGSGMVDLKNQLYYEVDVGYDPGDSFVYDFALDNSYGWAAAYSGGAVNPSNYNYGFENNGDLVRAGGVTNTNWWTQVTNYPLTASLTVKGLLSPLMLMTYIKINHVYYGSKRMTSGMYTVIGQTDTLGKDGFKTTLKLLRVAGDNQYLSTDARVAT